VSSRPGGSHRVSGRSSARGRGASSRTDPTLYTPEFSWRGDGLACEGVAVESIAERVGTPTYVYSSQSITDAYLERDRALGKLPHTICYSLKANANLSILRLLAHLGSGFDIVSGGELYRLGRAGISADRVVFSGVGKSREELREALRAGVRLISAESGAELELLASEAARLGRRAPASIRVNPDVAAGGHPHISTGHHTHKFGLDWADARKLYLAHRESRWIEWQGISAHIGSQILSLAPFRRALARLAGYYRELAREGIALRYLDFGGGLGVRYSDERPPAARDYIRAIADLARPLGCHLLIEPGRAIVAPAGVLLMRVLYTKRNRGKTFVIVDAAMNDFIRPSLYDAVHPITPVRRSRKATTARLSRVDVVGPVCESGDCFLQDWPLGEVSAGDLLVLWGAGAYGSVQASNYNARPRAAEVLVEGSRFRVIRQRESRSDLVRGE
jgi:diaminopimelate decarboxylase